MAGQSFVVSSVRGPALLYETARAPGNPLLTRGPQNGKDVKGSKAWIVGRHRFIVQKGTYYSFVKSIARFPVNKAARLVADMGVVALNGKMVLSNANCGKLWNSTQLMQWFLAF